MDHSQDPVAEQVRIRVTLGGRHLAFEGSRAFFDRHLDRVLEGALARHFRTPSEAAPPVDPTFEAPGGARETHLPSGGATLLDQEASLLVESDSEDEGSVGTAAHWPSEADLARNRPEPEGWSPRSDRFPGFLKQVGPRATTDEDQVLAFAFYLYQFERLEAFGPAELAGCFDTVGLPVPDDLSLIVADLAGPPRLLQSQPKGGYTLTPRGIATVKRELLG